MNDDYSTANVFAHLLCHYVSYEEVFCTQVYFEYCSGDFHLM